MTIDTHCRAFESAPLKFVVEDKTFYIHEELINLHSDGLKAHMQHPTKEKEQGCTVLKDVTEATFSRFLEW